MGQTLETFKKRKEYLICVDSDGCAMDTMDIKHISCFGPCMVKEWQLEEWGTSILERWNDINLYTMTRGINRFKGLAKMLREVHETYTVISGIEELEKWAESSNELSNAALKQAVEETGSACLKKALDWSEAVNRAISRLDVSVKKPFEGVKEGLARAHECADVAIVSSANPQAVLEEWERCGLLEYVDIMLAQDAGSKAYCIQELLKKGYDKDKVLMVGDAPGDRSAAEKNGVLFYPVCVKHEKESWQEFAQTALTKLKDGAYIGTYQEKKTQQFVDNLTR